MNDKQLSPNFHLSELTKSTTAARNHIDNTPNQQIINNLETLAKNILQPVRNHFNKPVIITSGYRSLVLNRSIKSSDSSQHVKGQAADFNIPGIDNLTLAKWIRDNLNFDQCILEFWTGGNTGWVHCSFDGSRNRKQILTINNKGTRPGFQV